MSERSIYFVSDLHGRRDRYEKLFHLLYRDPPQALLVGGDILPRQDPDPFLLEFLLPRLRSAQDHLAVRYPWIGLILGNDDPRAYETVMQTWEEEGLLHYLHDRSTDYNGWPIYGYACVPPTPFLFKDWERYDVSRYVDPGCIPPEEGIRSVPPDHDPAYRTIAADLQDLTRDHDLSRALFLFHTPPHQTRLDRLGGPVRFVDHAPVDMHVGSIAVRRLIEERQPRVTLHGHIHEAARVTGSWLDRIGETVCLSAAHDGPELAVVRFSPMDPGGAVRDLL